jgi:hypothetical protein
MAQVVGEPFAATPFDDRAGLPGLRGGVLVSLQFPRATGQSHCQARCGVLEGQVSNYGEYGERGGCGGVLCVAELATDADREYFQSRGSNVAATNARIAAIVHVVNHQYQRDVQISHVIRTQIVRTAEPDPYSSTDPNSILAEFQNPWNANQTSVQRDMAHLFTGKDLNGNTIAVFFSGIPITSTKSASKATESRRTVATRTATSIGLATAALLGRCRRRDGRVAVTVELEVDASDQKMKEPSVAGLRVRESQRQVGRY